MVARCETSHCFSELVQFLGLPSASRGCGRARLNSNGSMPADELVVISDIERDGLRSRRGASWFRARGPKRRDARAGISACNARGGFDLGCHVRLAARCGPVGTVRRRLTSSDHPAISGSTGFTDVQCVEKLPCRRPFMRAMPTPAMAHLDSSVSKWRVGPRRMNTLHWRERHTALTLQPAGLLGVKHPRCGAVSARNGVPSELCRTGLLPRKPPPMNTRPQIESGASLLIEEFCRLGFIDARDPRQAAGACNRTQTRWGTFSFGCAWLRYWIMPLSSSLIARRTDRETVAGRSASFFGVPAHCPSVLRQNTACAQTVSPL
jgi:hypothetical protein